MQTPTNFTVFPVEQKGDVYGTEFTFTSTLPSEYTAFAWSFGDGSIEYNKRSVSHAYNFPGIYTIALSAWTNDGTIYVDLASVDVDFAYRDAILFSQIPTDNGFPGLSSTIPFTVSLTSSRINDQLSVVLQPHNTKSIPYFSVPEKWKFITPTWRFVDAKDPSVPLNGSLLLSSTPIYKNNKVVAVKAEGSFYYIDDLPTINNECCLLITATLSTEQFSYPKESLKYPYASYSNSEVVTVASTWQINNVAPTKLKVTENFIHDIYPVKWADVPIPVMVTCESDNFPGYTITDLSYPKTNEYGAANPVTLFLSSNNIPIPDLATHFSVLSNLHFKNTDEYNNASSGYIFTTITPQSSVLTQVNSNSMFVVAASTVTTNTDLTATSFGFPIGYPIFSNAYVSHPTKSTVNKINIIPYSDNCPNINYYKDRRLLTEGSISFVDVPAISFTDLVNYTLSGTGGIYGMAFNPTLNRLYTVDADQNVVSSYHSGTTLLSSFQLSSVFYNEVLAPSYISIDKPGNIWISLFDDNKIIKLDSELNYLLSASPSGELPGDLHYPPIVETDKENNVWACYPDLVNSILVKFDSEGNEIARATELPANSMPISLAIDVTNKVWVACKHTNSLMLFDSEGTLITSVAGLLRPSYIALDRSGNVWVLHGYNLCSIYDPTTAELQTWRISTTLRKTGRVYEYTSEDVDLSNSEDEIWGGLAIDVYDRAWFIDSMHNVLISFNRKTPEKIQGCCIIPHADTQYVINAGDDFVTNIPADNIRSAQAVGDWTGNRWYQKYSGDHISNSVYGVSAPFKLYDINDSFQITRINEDFDCAGYFKSLALPEILSQNTALFDDFFGAAVGNGDPTNESIGGVVYEKIANFVSNHGDFETANIEQLVSIADQLSVKTKSFGKEFPNAINRLINIFSIPKQQLRGFLKLNNINEDNVRSLLTTKSMITADRFYLLKDSKYNEFQLLYVNPLVSDGSLIYPLSAFDMDGLRSPVYENYHVFEYDMESSDGYKGNVINWTSDYTTVGYSLSGNEEWYQDGGLVETMFNNLLTKRLYQQ